MNVATQHVLAVLPLLDNFVAAARVWNIHTNYDFIFKSQPIFKVSLFLFYLINKQ